MEQGNFHLGSGKVFICMEVAVSYGPEEHSLTAILVAATVMQINVTIALYVYVSLQVLDTQSFQKLY